MRRMLLGFAVLLAGCREEPKVLVTPTIGTVAQLDPSECRPGDILATKAQGGPFVCTPLALHSEEEVHTAWAEGAALQSYCMLDIVKRNLDPSQSADCRALKLPWPGPMEYYEKKYPVSGGKP